MVTKNPSTIRLIALPLSKQTQRSLIYFYAHQLAPTQPLAQTSESYRSPAFLIKKATDLGATQWNKLGLSPQTSWKFRIYTAGERFMDKIPFEEWALKSIDPETGPKSMGGAQDGASVGNLDRSPMIQLLYPGSLFKERELMEGFASSMLKCQPYHRKWMKLNILLSPLMLPVAIVPLIPNLPFFYMMWRAWSHWRAYNAARYLHQMIQHGRLQPIPCPILESLYASGRTRSEVEAKELKGQEKNRTESETDGPKQKDDEDNLILSHEMVTKLQKELGLPLESAREISRGIQQAKLRLRHSASTVNTDSSNHSSPSL